jgi:hypothetical protein
MTYVSRFTHARRDTQIGSGESPLEGRRRRRWLWCCPSRTAPTCTEQQKTAETIKSERRTAVRNPNRIVVRFPLVHRIRRGALLTRLRVQRRRPRPWVAASAWRQTPGEIGLCAWTARGEKRGRRHHLVGAAAVDAEAGERVHVLHRRNRFCWVRSSRLLPPGPAVSPDLKGGNLKLPKPWRTQDLAKGAGILWSNSQQEQTTPPPPPRLREEPQRI